MGSNTLHCVLLDMSASMLRGEKLALAKGCLLALTESFYRRREHLAVIGFSGNEARLLQAPGKVATFNAGWIAPLRGGGGMFGLFAQQRVGRCEVQLLAQCGRGGRIGGRSHARQPTTHGVDTAARRSTPLPPGNQ